MLHVSPLVLHFNVLCQQLLSNEYYFFDNTDKPISSWQVAVPMPSQDIGVEYNSVNNVWSILFGNTYQLHCQVTVQSLVDAHASILIAIQINGTALATAWSPAYQFSSNDTQRLLINVLSTAFMVTGNRIEIVIDVESSNSPVTEVHVYNSPKYTFCTINPVTPLFE